MARKGRRNRTLSAIFLISRLIIRIGCYVLLAFMIVYAVREAFKFGYSVFHSRPIAPPPGRDIAITVTDEMDGKDIAELLKERGLIKDENVFRVQERIYGYELYPGTYVLNTSQDVTEMLMIMSQIPETAEASETKEDKVIPEGETKKSKN